MIDSNKLIIGFDPGLINTGWGVIQKTNKSEICIDYGCISTIKNIELGKRLLFLFMKRA